MLLRHNDVALEWHHLCAQGLSPSAVNDEPLIHTGRDSGGAQTPGDDRELRGDISAHGFWKRGSTAIFDVRVTDVDNPSQRTQDPGKVIKRHEKEKKSKYLDLCLARRRSFTPLVFSVDGLRGTEADAASKRISMLLSKKWKKQYSEVCGYVRSRMSISLVRATSLCLRGVRDPTARPDRPRWEGGEGLRLYK